MRLEKVNGVYVFRPGDYELELKWFRAHEALDTLLTIGSILQTTNPRMAITQYQMETLKPFVWNRDNVRDAISNRMAELLQLRGDNKYLDTIMMVFRAGIEGIDLLFVLQIREQEPPLLRVATLDFETEHVNPAVGIFSSDFLKKLFENLILESAPDYAVLRNLPPVIEDWYEETRVAIDTQKVPITFEWFNFFSWDWVKRIGEKKFDNCPIGEMRKLPHGILYILQNEPFSYNNAEHCARQQMVNKHFELEKLHKKYPRQ